jgi:hypothetical protein
MGGREALLPSFGAGATSGQVVWFFLNRQIDDDERRRRVHLACRSKLDEDLCEVCGKPVNILDDYQDWIAKNAYSPEEWFKHQLQMSQEEKETRQDFFTKLFKDHEHRKVETEEAGDST